MRRITNTGASARGAVGLAALALFGGAACAGEDGGDAAAEGPQVVQARIVGGSAESGYLAVGALVDAGEAFCTGTLVAPRTVVTAAHCVDWLPARPQGLSFFVGDDVRRPLGGSLVAIESVHPHPDYGAGGEMVNDIAVVKLAAAPPVTPIPLLEQAMDASWVGRSAIFIGYGVTSATGADHGLKRSVSMAISEVMPTAFAYETPGRNTCFGDSGGPALASVGGQMHLIGVTSYGDEGCSVYGVNNRVDPYREFILGLLDGGEQAPPPSAPGDESGEQAGSDDICDVQGWYGDGVCDIGCAQPDVDCAGDSAPPPPIDSGDAADVCAAQRWYGDGVCDLGCAQPDPDCEAMTPCAQGQGDGGWEEAAGDTGGWGATPDDGSDYCEELGWYGDGWCDVECPRPDPDC